MSKVKFFVCGDTKAPQRIAGQDAGIDVFVPNISDALINDLQTLNAGHPYRWHIIGVPSDKEDENKGLFICVGPGCDINIPTYLKAYIPSDEYLRVANKSGVCTKQKFIVGADTIDSSYEGVIHIHLFNESNEMRMIELGQKIAQLIPTKINNEDIDVWYDSSIKGFSEFKNQTSVEDFYKGHDSVRKDSGFGSNYQDKKVASEKTEAKNK